MKLTLPLQDVDAALLNCFSEDEAEGEEELSPNSLERPVHSISEYHDLVSSNGGQQPKPSENAAEPRENERMSGLNGSPSAEEESDSSEEESDSGEDDTQSDSSEDDTQSDSSEDDTESDSSEDDTESDSSEDDAESESEEDQPTDTYQQDFKDFMTDWTSDLAPEIAELAQSVEFRQTLEQLFYVTMHAPLR